MGKRKELGYHKGSRQFRKIYKGKTYYLGKGDGPNDVLAFNDALYRWEKMKTHLLGGVAAEVAKLLDRLKQRERRHIAKAKELNDSIKFIEQVLATRPSISRENLLQKLRDTIAIKYGVVAPNTQRA